jgi:hypothetical protein
MATNTVKMVIQFRRDTTANWEQYSHIVPAAGEPCFDIELGTLKIGDGVKSYGELTAIGGGSSVSVSADGKSIVIEDGFFKLAGFDAAEVGAQPRKNADGNIEWVVPSTETADGLQDAVAGLQSDVSSLQDDIADLKAIVGTTEDELDGTLLDRVTLLETSVNTLNGDSKTEGSILKIVKDEINAFANEISDNGTIDTLKELVDYVANHGGEIETLVNDITTLQDLVGSESVSDQIAAGVSGKVDAETGKSLVSDDLIAKLEKMDASAQANKIEEVYLGDTLLEVVDKKVVLPIGAGLKFSEEISVSEDGTVGIGTISFSKIVQTEGETVIMDGGGAAG